MKDDFLKDLNESQQQAVLYNDGASLVIAGAGSGKTRVLTCKIAYLLSLGYNPDSILALTFTNKAAREMKSRIGRLVGDAPARRLWMGTFHSIFLRILRAHADKIGLPSQFTIYDTTDSKSLLRSIIKEMSLDDKIYPAGKIQSRISNLKNHLVLPADYDHDGMSLQDDIKNKQDMFHIIYHAYQTRCITAGAMDFDDMLVNTYKLFNENSEILFEYTNRFKYVLVDEYQDTNYVQRKIILQLGKSLQHVCVVGDDAQSIYSFRGADIDNILSFQQDFKNTKIFKLEQNYRSTQNIVLAANSLIQKNHRQIPKSIFSMKEKGEQILVSKASSDIEESSIVVNNILKLRSDEKVDYSDFAILYRTNAQSRVFEEELRKTNIPYRIYGGLSFYQRKEIKDVISYFRLAVNPDDEEALRRIINFPARGIGDTTLNKIKEAAIQKRVSLWTVLCNSNIYGLNFNKGKSATLERFSKLIQGFITNAKVKNAYEIGEEVITAAGLINISVGDLAEDNNRKENIGELITGMNDFVLSRREDGNEKVSLSDYLSEISLLTDQDTNEKDGDDDKVTLMTIHAAKGLEFPTVFVVGMEENLFPNYMSLNSERELEEERRLFYVAITRAEKHCFLSYAESRYHFGQTEFMLPSRFLNDIDEKYLRHPAVRNFMNQIDERASKLRPVFERSISNSFSSAQNTDKRTTYAKGLQQQKLQTSSALEKLDLKVGQIIKHERFGVGEVNNIEGTGENVKATIQFQNVGTKVLLLRFARLEVIG